MKDENQNTETQDPCGAPRNGPATGSIRRPPCALMSKSAAIAEDSMALRKMCDAGFEVVVVLDADIEETLRIIERVRKGE